ncbi:MAG: hypothetical protein U1F76_24175 [Candidatus Competibacteraceae bacterium]
MNTQHTNTLHTLETPPWRKTPLALALLAALQVGTVQPALAAGPPTNPVGSEFQINTTTSGSQYDAAIAVDAAGDFVVAWHSYGQDGDSWGVYAQRYDAAGVPQGAEFQVNTTTASDQGMPAVAMDAAGDLVVVWASRWQDGDGTGIYAQRYNAAGVPQGGEFQVNTTTASWQESPAVAMDAAGDFVVAWQSYGQDGDGWGIYAQRYSAAGAPQGGEFQVNTTTAGHQAYPAVALDAAGDVVVAWQSYGQDGDGYGVYAQRYSAAGAPQGGEFQVNTTTASYQSMPAVAMDAAGDVVVAWESYGQDGDSWGIYAQRYSAAGVPQGAEFRVNTTTASWQDWPVVALDAAGDFVIAWQSQGQDGDVEGMYAQRYALNNYNAAFPPPTLSNQRTSTTPVAEGPAGTFSFDATYCNLGNSAYPLSGLANRTAILSNGNCLVNRTYGPAGTPALEPGVAPCGVGSTLEFPLTGDYSDDALGLNECVTVHYQLGLRTRNRFNFWVDVGGI